MRSNIVFTFIGEDKPGLVEQISLIVNDHQGNWLESRMNRLAGKFAGIIQVGVDTNHVEGLISSLENLKESGLSVVVERADSPGKAGNTHTLSLLGLDRPGIVRDVSSALSRHNINVLEMNTDIVHAAMTGEPMFEARAVIEYAADTNLEQLAEDLEAISGHLGLDIELGEENT